MKNLLANHYTADMNPNTILQAVSKNVCFQKWANRFILSILLIGFLSGCAELREQVQIPKSGESAVSAQPQRAFEPDGFYESFPTFPEKGYLLEPLAKDVYFFSTGTYNNLFVVTSEGILIVDPIGGQGSQLQKAIAEVTSLPVKFMIYSHYHLDHIGDAHLFATEGVRIIAHKATKEMLLRYKDPKRPPPHMTFEESYTLNFAGLRIELIYPGPGHGEGNIAIFIPERKVLMYVDVATPKSVPFKNFSTTDIYGQILGIQKVLKLDFEKYVAGHLFRTGTKAEMREVLHYYYAVREASRKALSAVTFKDVYAKSKSRDMERVFAEYYEAVAEACYRMLKKDWKQRLMGFEGFAHGHCDVWTNFHRTQMAP